MNDKNLIELMSELENSGAAKNEAEELAFLSKNLSNLYKLERSDEFKNRFLAGKDFSKKIIYVSRRAFLGAFLSLILLLGFVSVVSAQASLPGEPLYPVKRLSENIASFINPTFKGEVLRRRSEEIKGLSNKNDSSDFHKTVVDYEKELSENKKINPEKIEESKKNLEEAKKNSREENKQDIEKVIMQTEDKQELLKKQDVKGDMLTPTSFEVNKDGEQNKNLNKEPEKSTNPLDR